MTGEQDLNTLVEAPTKKLEYGLVGIIFGLVLVAVVIFSLNYFNIINLPLNLPHQQTQQYKATTINVQPTPEILPGSQKISPALEAKAEAVGYKIIWQGDPNDLTGRTIMASEERKYPDGISAFGSNLPGEMTGIFKKFETPPNSQEMYIVLKIPTTGKEFKFKVIANSEDKNADINIYPTAFFVENLDIIPSDKNMYAAEKLFDFRGSDENKKNMQILIKPGDVLKIIDNGKGDAFTVIIKRFGGKKQTDEELKV